MVGKKVENPLVDERGAFAVVERVVNPGEDGIFDACYDMVKPTHRCFSLVRPQLATPRVIMRGPSLRSCHHACVVHAWGLISLVSGISLVSMISLA